MQLLFRLKELAHVLLTTYAVATNSYSWKHALPYIHTGMFQIFESTLQVCPLAV